MNKGFRWLLLLSIFLAACSTATPKAGISSAPGEKLIWASDEGRPLWTGDKIRIEDKKLFLVTMAAKYANEAETRDEALLKTAQSLSSYLTELAKGQYEKTAADLGLDLTTVDPVVCTKQYEKQLEGSVTSKIAVQRWYLEYWETPTGKRWNAFVTVMLPLELINGNFKTNAQENEVVALKKAKTADKEPDKKQAEGQTKFWAEIDKKDLLVQPEKK